jgi:arginine/ornithine transport system permease protein
VNNFLNFGGYEKSLLDGSLLTIGVALTALVISLIFGLSAAVAKLSNRKLLRLVATLYAGIVRGIPDLVLMLLFFFGGQILINNLAERFHYDGYIDVNPFTAGTLSMGFIYGAYMCETFRGAILAVDRGEIEAGYAFGMTNFHVLRKILLPQMLRHALPSLGNNWLVLLKGTAIVSVIGLDDLVRKAALASGATQQPFKFYFFVSMVFLAFTSISLLILRWADRKYSVGFREI